MSKLHDYLPDTIEEKGTTFVQYNKSWDVKEGLKYAKENKLKYRIVKVLAKNLRGKRGTDNLPYKPTEWVFVEKKS